MEVSNYISNIRVDRYKKILESVGRALEDHGGSQNTINSINLILSGDSTEKQLAPDKGKPNAQHEIRALGEAASNTTKSNPLSELGRPAMQPPQSGAPGGQMVAQIDVIEKIDEENQQLFLMLKNFQQLRLFFCLKLAVQKERYEKMISEIRENNQSNEELFKKIVDLQKQNE